MKNIIGLDIGGTNLRIGLVRGDVVERGATFSTHETLTNGDEIALLAGVIRDFCGDETADAVSIGFPSPISADGKVVLNAPNIINRDGSRAFKGKNVADPLAQALGLPVLLGKDANHLLCYDAHVAGAAGTLVGCYIGTGFGSAVMIDGKFVKGKHGAAMEAGHIPFFRNERPCNCGKIGCAECYASGRAAKAMLETHYPGLSFPEVFRDHADEAPVVELVEAIGVTVATLVNLFDPDMLFLGGGVLSAEFPRERLREVILRHTLSPYPREDLDMRFSAHDAFAGVVGAALSAKFA